MNDFSFLFLRLCTDNSFGANPARGWLIIMRHERSSLSGYCQPVERCVKRQPGKLRKERFVLRFSVFRLLYITGQKRWNSKEEYRGAMAWRSPKPPVQTQSGRECLPEHREDHRGDEVRVLQKWEKERGNFLHLKKTNIFLPLLRGLAKRGA